MNGSVCPVLADGALTLFYLACGVVGLYRGYRPVYVGIAVVLAIAFQYILGFFMITKIIVALILGYYLLLPRSRSSPENEEAAAPAQNQTEVEADPDDEEAIEAVFQDFQNFTGRNGRNETGQRGAHR